MQASRVLRWEFAWSSVLSLSVACLAGCTGVVVEGTAEEEPSDATPGVPNIPEPPDEAGPHPFPWPGPSQPEPSYATCDPARSIKSDGSGLIVRTPEVLARFELKTVLTRLLSLAGSNTPPELLLQRLFDTNNTEASAVFKSNIHCDTPGNEAFMNGGPVGCSRAEGALAKSKGLFVEGSPDYFMPVALVNRLDLMSTSLSSCGEFRIVYAKQSGRTDPNNRVFLNFEAIMPNPNPGDVMACWPLAKAWADMEKMPDPEKIADFLEHFYFDGLDGFFPLVHPERFGSLSTPDDSYGDSHGQVRLSQGMQAPWDMREFNLRQGPNGFAFMPVTVKSNPISSLFNESADAPPGTMMFRVDFLQNMPLIAGSERERFRLVSNNQFNAGQSTVSGAAVVDYVSSAEGFKEQIEEHIEIHGFNAACPPNTQLTADDVLHRATVQTCAGCHAPQKFLGPDRNLGCGVQWPAGGGEAHIDENGKLSPALTEMFLPHRASVMTTYLQACNSQEIWENLEPVSLKDASGGP